MGSPHVSCSIREFCFSLVIYGEKNVNYMNKSKLHYKEYYLKSLDYLDIKKKKKIVLLIIILNRNGLIFSDETH